MRQPLPGFTPWPHTLATRYRERGYWAGIDLYSQLDHAAQEHATRTALVCGERRWSYAEFALRVRRFASGLAALRVAPRDRVLLQLPNIAEFHVACFALFRLGAIPVFALPAHRRVELGHFVQQTQAQVAITIDREAGYDHRELMRQVQGEHPVLRDVIVVGDAQELHAFDSLYAEVDERAVPPLPAASEVALLQLSGGSTGVPKLIPRTHDDYLYSIRESARICSITRDTVYLCALPAAHNFPMSSPGAFGVLHAGGCVVMARHAAAAHCFELIASERVTITALVPALALAWMESRLREQHDLRSVQVIQVGGSHLAPGVARRVPEVFGCALQQVFGMAEGLVNYTRLDDPPALVLGSQGRPISDDDEIRIVDERDRDVPEGEVGHLLTRGPYTLRGYYCADSHNADAFTTDGFYRTGDRVRRLRSGHLVVEGRVKDQINRGGDKIAAEEVESHLLAHPQVLNVAVVAMPDRWLGEKVAACVVAREPSPSSRVLQAFLRERGIAAYKIPDRFDFMPLLPRTAVGKVDKGALRARFVPGDALLDFEPDSVSP